MPRRNWKYRTEWFKSLSEESQLEVLSPDPFERRISTQPRISAKFAKWAYRKVPMDDSLRVEALRNIAEDENCPWAREYLWRELEKHKRTTWGDFVIIAMCGYNLSPEMKVREMGRFASVFRDEEAHPMTRGSAIYAISHLVSLNEMTIKLAPPSDVAEVCREALWNPKVPYGRAGACHLARQLGLFWERIQELTEDKEPTYPGATVSSVAIEVVEDYG